MKILNIKTNNVFDLPKDQAKKLLEDFPEEFSKGTKPKALNKNSNKTLDKDSILSQILE